ncbi:MAG: GMC family oxidoreductase [Campylobacterota bacterium]|nr:GMC family oxidoreductase [Campylobacterota bacterium]
MDWKLSQLDKYTIKRAALRFAEMFARIDLGRVRIDDWVFSDNPGDFPGFPHRLGGPHHMCTTRMSSSPKDGVVDVNHKVFGIDNLYMAGSSVFSTTGHINPTFSIVQMSLRLADHLNRQFGYKSSVEEQTVLKNSKSI